MTPERATSDSMAGPYRRMPGTLVVKRCFIGARGIARGTFMKERRDRVFGFGRETLGVFEVGRRLAEQWRRGEQGRLRFRAGCGVRCREVSLQAYVNYGFNLL